MKPIKICSIPECAKKAKSRGWCEMHYTRWKRSGSPVGSTLRTLEERFWQKVNKTDGCWEWTARISSTGYGQFSDLGKALKAHRTSYEIAHGPIPAGMLVDHLCHNTICVNPAHLRLATNKQNLENRAGAQSNSKSGIRGVHWAKREERWVAAVGHDGKKYRAGYFVDIADAEAAVIAKRLELHTFNLLDRIPA